MKVIEIYADKSVAGSKLARFSLFISPYRDLDLIRCSSGQIIPKKNYLFITDINHY
jgi:hypothetical protein